MSAQLQPASTGQVIASEDPATYYRRSLDVANSTGLRIIDGQSPAHFKYWVENPHDDSESEALAFGKAFHCATLEPDVFAAEYVVLPAGAPQRPTAAMWSAAKSSPESQARKDWWTAWSATSAGRIELSAADYDRAQRMADSVRAHPVAAGLLVGGQREVTFRWVDDDTGLACKSRVDLFEPGEYLMDLKNTRDASPEGFARAAAGYRYDAQAAHYMEGARACDKAVGHFIVLACENAPPYVCVPYYFGPVEEQRGWNLRQRAIRKQAECLRTGKWPGYADTLTQLTYPTWAHYGIEAAQ